MRTCMPLHAMVPHAGTQFLRSLRHRNIVFFYGAGDLTTAPFLVTEFMARGTLSDILASSEPLDRMRCARA